MNYKEAGVDVEKGDLFIDKIKPFIKDTYNENVVSGVGGFAALYDQGDHYLATGTDGVGTKIKLAIELAIHDSIGQDLVAMCVNDILCTGATPMFFLDYLATSKLDLTVHEQVVKGIAQGCKLAGCALIGGETAEMPGMYAKDDYDLAGFVVGTLPKDKMIDGKQINSGMEIWAIPSSGFHSNGYSLLRKLIESEDNELKCNTLTPTRIYTQEVKAMLANHQVYGMAHITGGGLNNIKRINENFGYEVSKLPELPPFMDAVISKANMTSKELYTTFNMGVGFIFVLDKGANPTATCPDAIKIGDISSEFKGVKVLNTQI